MPADAVSYNPPANVVVFNARGTCNAGYVYMSNIQNAAYAVGTRASGIVLLRKWSVGSGPLAWRTFGRLAPVSLRNGVFVSRPARPPFDSPGETS